MAVLLILLILPDQIPELILSCARYKQPTQTGGRAAIALIGFSSLFLVYSFELILNYLAQRPGDLLQTRLRSIVPFFGAVAFSPGVVMAWQILFVAPSTIGGVLLSKQSPDAASEFTHSALKYAATYGTVYVAAVSFTISVYYLLFGTTRLTLQHRTAWLRRIILFRMAPVVAIGHFGVVIYWLFQHETRTIELGTFYFFIQFCTGWLVLFSLAIRSADRYRFPIISVFIMYWLAISYKAMNEHHIIAEMGIVTRLVDSSNNFSSADAVPAGRAYMNMWLMERITPSITSGQTALTAYVVAAQGGGMYAADHAAQVLSQLSAESPSFTDNLFGISSVSGGSLGVAFYATLLAEHAKQNTVPGENRCETAGKFWRRGSAALHELARSDFLSPIVTAGLYIDTLQQMNFFASHIDFFQFDRARFFEDSIVKRFSAAAEKQGLGPQAMDAMGSGMQAYQGQSTGLPSLFFNVTSVQTGHRMYFAPYDVEFGDPNTGRLVAFDTISGSHRERRSLVGVDVSMLRAASASARFPFISPPAGVKIAKTDGSKEVWWLADGAYFENSGVATALEVIDALEETASKLRSSDSLFSRVRVNVKLIALTSDDALEDDRSLGFLEQLSPPRTLFASRSARGQDFVEAAIRKRPSNSVARVVLGDKSFKPPLGWVLSNPTIDEIERRSMLGVRKLLGENNTLDGFVPRECSLMKR